MSDTNLNEKRSLTNSNEDNNCRSDVNSSPETSFANAENESSMNIANNYIYLLNNDLNRIMSESDHLNQYLPVYKPQAKLINNILNDDSLTTTSSSTLSINHQQPVEIVNINDYDYIYNKYNQFKNATSLMQTFKSSIQQTNEDKQKK